MTVSTLEIGLIEGMAVFAALLLLGTWLLTLTGHHRATVNWQLRLFLTAASIRFLASVAVYQFGLVNIIGDEDGSGWTVGAGLAQQWWQDGATFLDLPFRAMEAYDHQNKGYRYLVAVVVFLTGAPVRMVPAGVNCVMGGMICVLAYRIAATLFNHSVAERVGWWCCFWPALIIWSAQTVKETTVIFLECLALYGCLRLRGLGFSPRHLALCVATTLLLLPFRFYAAFIVVGAAFLGLATASIKNVRSAGGTVLLALALAPFILGGSLFLRHEAQVRSFDLEYVQKFKRGVSEGGRKQGAGSAVAEEADLNTRRGLAQSVLVGAVHLALAPFPWQLGGGSSLRMLLTLPELVYWWWLFFAGLVPGTIYALRRRLLDVMPVLIFLVGFGLLYSLLFANVGLIFRQRAQLLPWLLIFASVGLELRRFRRMGFQVTAGNSEEPDPTARSANAPSSERYPGQPAPA